MNLLCVGISHHTAPLDVRERLWFSDAEIRQVLLSLKQFGCAESVLFSTCNRTELYVLTETPDTSADPFKTFLIEQKNAALYVPAGDLFSLRDGDAARHLFRVAAGIDSMVLGDVQILMQVKDGLAAAVEQHTAGIFMNRLFQLAFRVGKRSRTETAIGEGAVSVSYAAVELTERIFDDLNKKTALVIGAGETAELTATHLRGKNIGKLLITNRTREHAEQLAQKVQGNVVTYDQWCSALADADIVLSSVEVPSFILRPGDIEQLRRKRTAGPLFLIDLGVPRNIDPAVKELENVFLYDIDSLQMLVNETLHRRAEEVPKVESIVDTVLKELQHWYSSLEVNPTITALSQFMENIRKDEIEKQINRFETKDRELVELLTKRIVNKILHTPITQLKNGTGASLSDRLQKLHALQALFELTEEKQEDADAN
ncbi:MAG TPA: glutamyl-tRNA reductase [Bacteroidota bacterium]|nr:glutamyl-tRNA reductase [Bacteroidota bacterium]